VTTEVCEEGARGYGDGDGDDRGEGAAGAMVSKAMMVAVAAAVVGIEVTMVRESEVGDVGDQGKVKAITALLRSGKVRSIQPSGASERGADYALRRRANAFFAASRSTRTHQQDQDTGLALGIRHASTSTSTSTPFGARLRHTHCQIVSPRTYCSPTRTLSVSRRASWIVVPGGRGRAGDVSPASAGSHTRHDTRFEARGIRLRYFDTT
jgi:hypothetical protein